MVSKKSYGYMEIASSIMLAFVMAIFYYLLHNFGLLNQGEFYLTMIVMLVTTIGTIVTTLLVVRMVKR